jgi:phosphonate degradation associated HDIG domain protein
MSDIAGEILKLYARKGEMSYGEGVTMTAHALQAAQLAEQAEAGNALIVAALLHDIGHLLQDLPEDIADEGVDSQHEAVASAWLSQHFPPAVSEPVRLHVAAKRYLCTTEPEYLGQLSPASVLSLRLQGGPMSPAEVADFAHQPFAEAGVRLRRWDDLAKRRDLATPDLAHYRPMIEAVLRSAHLP